jgi:8-oxo-dGTP diphosphatase
MKQLKSIYAKWGSGDVRLTWIPHREFSEDAAFTSVHAICVKDEHILLTQIPNRGFNFPGGHIEQGEQLEQAIHREVYEEGYVKGTLQYLGAIEVSHEENPLFNPQGKYPLIGYQAFYRLNVTECLPFLREHEATARIWVEPSEVPYVMNDHGLAIEILREALLIGEIA